MDEDFGVSAAFQWLIRAIHIWQGTELGPKKEPSQRRTAALASVNANNEIMNALLEGVSHSAL